jgi:Tol biopolymer transport system component
VDVQAMRHLLALSLSWSLTLGISTSIAAENREVVGSQKLLCESVNNKALGSISKTLPNGATKSPCNQIAFTRYEDFLPYIYVMFEDGSNQRKAITNGYSPKISPDGKKILFLRNGLTGSEIFVANIDGSGISQLTHNGEWTLSPAWSPNGKFVAFVSGEDISGVVENLNPFDIYTMNADGSEKRRLTNTPNFERDVTWSPNGRQIAFMRDLGSTYNGPFNIFTMNEDGSNQVNISGNSCSDFHPSWSPKGNTIAFVTNCGGSNTEVFHMPEIYVMNSDGSERKRLTYISDEANENRRYAYYPSWSPNGLKIAFTAVTFDIYDANWEIFALELNRNTLVNLTSNPKQDQEPSWSK